jgi:hypothetical protein
MAREFTEDQEAFAYTRDAEVTDLNCQTPLTSGELGLAGSLLAIGLGASTESKGTRNNRICGCCEPYAAIGA